MNPAYRKGFLLRCASSGIPADAASLMLKAAEADPNLARATELFKDWLTVRKHTVRNGEVLSGVANKYGVGLQDLMKENNLPSAFVRTGQVLRIPNAKPDGAGGKNKVQGK